MKTKADGMQNMYTGRAGELAVASQLFLRQCPVMFPSVDVGADLHAQLSGCRIQVKSAHICATPKIVAKCGRGLYFFPLLKTKRRAITKDRSVMRPRLAFAAVCDFVVFWGIEENRFWIVPAALADKSTGLALGAVDPERFVGSVQDMRDMRALGYSLQKIADHYGILRHTVMNLLRTDKQFQGASITSQVRQYENRWDLITDFTPATAQANQDTNFADSPELSAAAGE